VVEGVDFPPGYVFHHIGYATTSIAYELQFLAFLGYRQEGEQFVDQIQGVAGQLLVGQGPRIELLEPLPNSETLAPWLCAGIKMYHLAYEVRCIEQVIEWARSKKAKVIVQPTCAIAFDMRRICFMMFRNRLLAEFIETFPR